MYEKAVNKAKNQVHSKYGIETMRSTTFWQKAR